jgi:hypothetical protein
MSAGHVRRQRTVRDGSAFGASGLVAFDLEARAVFGASFFGEAFGVDFMA